MRDRKPSSDLFNLVKSLSEDEVIYFHRYTSRQHISERDNFLELLKLLREQELYDEKVLKASISDRTWAKRLAYSKNELLQYVSDSLMANSSNSSADREIYYLIELAELLKQKSLFKLAAKKLLRAKEMSLQFEKLNTLLEILEVQRSLIKQLPVTDLKKELDQINTEKVATLERIQNTEHYSHLNDTVYLLYRQYNLAREQSKLDELKTIMQCPSLQNQELAITFEAKFKYLIIYSHYYQMKADFAKALQQREKIVLLWESHPHLVAEMPQRYRTELANLLSVSHLAGKYEGFEALIKKIEKASKASFDDEAFVFRQVYHLKQLYLLNTGKIKEAYAFIPEIKKKLEIYAELINPVRLHTFWYNNAMTCFLMEKYQEALPWTTLILTPGIDKKARTDLRDFISILELILYYEIGKYDLVETKMRNTRLRLSYKNKLHNFEKVVLQNIGVLIKAAGDKVALPKALKVFNQELENLARQTGKDQLPGLEEFLIWINNKQVR